MSIVVSEFWLTRAALPDSAWLRAPVREVRGSVKSPIGLSGPAKSCSVMRVAPLSVVLGGGKGYWGKAMLTVKTGVMSRVSAPLWLSLAVRPARARLRAPVGVGAGRVGSPMGLSVPMKSCSLMACSPLSVAIGAGGRTSEGEGAVGDDGGAAE